MSASKDLEGLVNQITSARNDRMVLMNNLKENFSRIKQDTAGLRHESVSLLKSIAGNREEMTQVLHRQLDKDRNNLDMTEKERRKKTAIDHNNRTGSIRELKNTLRSDMKDYETDRMADAKENKAHRLAGIQTIKTEVGKMQEDVQAGLKQIRNYQKKMGDELSSFLKTFISDIKANEKGRKSSVNDFLKSVKTELSAMSSAWEKVLSGVSLNEPQIFQGDAEPEPDKEDDTGEEPEGQMPPGWEIETEAGYESGPIKEKVMSTLSDYSDGLKMTQLAELLDIEQWRLLIPVMRDLLESNQIKKEGALYFTS